MIPYSMPLRNPPCAKIWIPLAKQPASLISRKPNTIAVRTKSGRLPQNHKTFFLENKRVSPRRNGNVAFGPLQTNMPVRASHTGPHEPKSISSGPSLSACTSTTPSAEQTLAAPGAVKQCTPACAARAAIASAVMSAGVTFSTNVASGRAALSASSFLRISGARLPPRSSSPSSPSGCGCCSSRAARTRRRRPVRWPSSRQ